MVVGNASSARNWPWNMPRHQWLYVVAPLLTFAFAWWVSSALRTPFHWAEALFYSIFHLVLILLRRMGLLRLPISVGLGLIADLVLSLILLSQVRELGYAFYPLYAMIALRALSVYRLTPVATIVPFLLGILYMFMRLLVVPFGSMPLAEQQAAIFVLLGSVGFTVLSIWASTFTVRSNVQLEQNLRNAQRAADLRVSQLERSANDLRTRMREQHALEEGLRVITSSLSLDEVLSQIVDSTVQMIGRSRISGVTLSLLKDSGLDHRSASDDTAVAIQLADIIAVRTLAQQVPLIVNEFSHDSELALQHNVVSVLSVPLFVGEGEARGALTVVSAERSAFDSIDARHLSSLALQAGIALQNAEFHSQMQQQRKLMESVMRDITDALVVLNPNQNIVLMNPHGRRLMDTSSELNLREEIFELATKMRAEGLHVLAREMQLGDDASSATIYQAWASLVRQSSSEEPMVAVVFHDITAQKAEERGKQEFISMVAHELRNPLHSMNGFVKLVVQGKVGDLNEMQQEFLGIVDDQIGLLNGRISELLEYNRVQAGRLVLNPQRGDLTLLAMATVTRLSLEAQNRGISLFNEVAQDLPECYFDNERIGQVMTNLIENAMKAMPSGGNIWVRSELHDDEVFIRVYDTGVGIDPDEKAKIFQAFYRAHDRASSKGNHLGLGLTICKQIIEGHHGRIWVDSELGKGSIFSFSLPLIDQERALGE